MNWLIVGGVHSREESAAAATCWQQMLVIGFAWEHKPSILPPDSWDSAKREHIRVFEWFTFSNIGNVASILGVCLSLYLIYNVREIRKSYLFTARAPALLKSLRAHSSNIKDLLKEFETSIEEIEAELARCLPTLESLENKVGRHERRSISVVIRQIASNKSLSKESKNTVWSIYKGLLKIEEELRNLHKDRQWER